MSIRVNAKGWEEDYEDFFEKLEQYRKKHEFCWFLDFSTILEVLKSVDF